MAPPDEHQTVRQFRERAAGSVPVRLRNLGSTWLRTLCLEAGADEVGFVEVGRKELAEQKADIDILLPETKTLIGFVCRMNRDNVRPPARSVANLEFHHVTHEINDVARKIVSALEREGVRAVNGGGLPHGSGTLGDEAVAHLP